MTAGEIVVKPHEGTIALRNGFDKVWKALGKKGEANLRTDKKGTPFIAKAGIAQKGPHRGRRVILFFRNGTERARSYECCWGHYVNCNRTRIGMYCKTLDAYIWKEVAT